MIFKLWIDDPRVGLGWREFLILRRGHKWVRLLVVASFDTLKLSVQKFDGMKKTEANYSRSRLLKRLSANAAAFDASDGLLREARAAVKAFYDLRAASRPAEELQPAAPVQEDDMKKKTKKTAKPAKRPAPAKKVKPAKASELTKRLEAERGTRSDGGPITAPKKPGGKRGQILEAAQNGKLPEPPDFSAATHERFRPKLAELVELAKKGDVKGLKAYPINPISTSPKAMDRFRNLCVIALEAQAAVKKAA